MIEVTELNDRIDFVLRQRDSVLTRMAASTNEALIALGVQVAIFAFGVTLAVLVFGRYGDLIAHKSHMPDPHALLGSDWLAGFAVTSVLFVFFAAWSLVQLALHWIQGQVPRSRNPL